MSAFEDYRKAKQGVEAARVTLGKYTAAGVKPAVKALADRYHQEVIVKIEVRYPNLKYEEAEHLAEIITTLFAHNSVNILQQGFEYITTVVKKKREEAIEEAERELDVTAVFEKEKK